MKMSTAYSNGPDSTAVRVALWRAMHVQIDPSPHVLEDEVGLQLSKAGVPVPLSLSAGGEVASKLSIFEVDQPGTQAWKQRRLMELGFGIPKRLHFVPVDFESDVYLWKQLAAAGFEKNMLAIVSSTGVSMYLTKDAITGTLREMADLAPHSKFVMTFMLPLKLVEPEDQPGYQMALKGAQASGTPFISFFSPQEMVALARDTGFSEAQHLSVASLSSRYFSGRRDNLRPSSGEELLIAIT